MEILLCLMVSVNLSSMMLYPGLPVEIFTEEDLILYDNQVAAHYVFNTVLDAESIILMYTSNTLYYYLIRHQEKNKEMASNI